MDTDLFQWLAVGLLGAIAVLLVVAIATLERMRRALREGGGARIVEAPTADAAVVADTGGAVAAEGAPGEAAAGEGPDERAGGTPSREREREVAAAAPGHERDAEAAGRDAQAEAEPEEQPFERDGRWWFRRGEELLVYDEGTGEWLEAPGARRGAGSAAEEAAAGDATLATGTRTSISAERGPQELAGASASTSSAFWKCPTCGAVNGATASSCRMCFTARP